MAWFLQLRNPQSSKCLDTLGHREGKVVGAYPCHGHGVNQEFHYTDLDQIVYEDDLCLDVPRSKLKNPVEIQICHFMGGNQKWKYNNQVRTGGLYTKYAIFS